MSVKSFSTKGWRIDNIKYPIDFYDYGLSASFFFLEISKLAWMICYTHSTAKLYTSLYGKTKAAMEFQSEMFVR